MHRVTLHSLNIPTNVYMRGLRSSKHERPNEKDKQSHANFMLTVHGDDLRGRWFDRMIHVISIDSE